jgi:hypothetical protein
VQLVQQISQNGHYSVAKLSADISRNTDSLLQEKKSLVLTEADRQNPRSSSKISSVSGLARPCLSSDKSDSGDSEENMVANLRNMNRLDIGQQKLSKTRKNRPSGITIERA